MSFKEKIDELLEEAIVASLSEKKKMDPVGKADADIDNDGDVDSSDKYLHNRRKAIKKSMGKESKVEINPQIDEISKKTLGSYINKASQSAAQHSADAVHAYMKDTDAGDAAADKHM